MVLAIIGFGPNSLLIFETVLSRNTFWYTSCSLNLMLSAQLLSQNIPRYLILYSIPRSLVPLTIYPRPVTGVMHEADDAYSIQSTWVVLLAGPISHTSTQCMDFVEILNISLDLSTIYFAHFSGCRASFVYSCHFILECCGLFSEVKLRIRLFVLFQVFLFLKSLKRNAALANFNFMNKTEIIQLN